MVQLYVRFPSSRVARPIRELKGFQRFPLRPGETRTVTLPLVARSLAVFDPTLGAFVVEPGPVEVEIGASSRDIRLSLPVAVGS